LLTVVISAWGARLEFWQRAAQGAGPLTKPAQESAPQISSAYGATRTCHNVRYPVVMGGQADLEEATRNQLDLWFEKTLAPDGKPTK
jgi:hypothetical protein